MTATPVVEDHPLTLKENAQWMLHRLSPGRGICNLGVVLRADIQLRWWPLQETLNHLLRRHPALRATLRLSGATARKAYLPPDVEFPLTIVSGSEDGLEDQIAALGSEPFDVEGGLLVRAHLLLLPEGCVLCLVMHHLVTDYTSFNLLLEQFIEVYELHAAGAPVPAELEEPVPAVPEAEPDPVSVNYWTRTLEGADPARMALAGARPIVGRPTFAGDIVSYRLAAGTDAAIETLRQRAKLTTNVVMLAVYFLTLARHGAGPDLVVGVPVNARRGAAKQAVGFHANTLPIRVHVDPAITVDELLRRVSHAFLHGLEHASVSFESMQFELRERSPDWRTPLLHHMFNFRPPSGVVPRLGGGPLRVTDLRRKVSRLDVEWEVWSKPSGTEIFARYSTEVHSEHDMLRMLERYEALAHDLAGAGPETPIGWLTGWTPDDRAVVERLNQTAREWPSGTAADLVLAAARSDPRAVAFHGDGPDDPDWDYRRLAAGAGGVAGALRGAGVGPGDVVALHARRGPLLAAAVLGVWLTGAAYLPLDPGHPPARLVDQLDDAGVRVVLVDEPLPPALVGPWVSLVLAEVAADGPPVPDSGVAAPDDVAYLIYTSGSTGRPKGVEVTQGNLANLLHHFATELGVRPADRMLWSTTFSFDVSALELFVPLMRGASIVVAPDALRVRPRSLLDAVERSGVTIMQATPTTWRQLAPELPGRLGRVRLLVGGEAATPALAAVLVAEGREVRNVYGPTETTIWSTSARLGAAPAGEVTVPIGRPIANTSVRLVDAAGFPVPPGVPGELWIGGAGVARGYHDRATLTAERFVEVVGEPGGRYYRTGDLAVIAGDALHFLGREDRQVKVRGHRLELDEVETVLEAHPQVAAAAVVLIDGPDGHGVLAGAIRPTAAAGDTAAWLQDLRAHAVGRLPAAAVPGHLRLVEDFPLTGNGKIDSQALARWFREVSPPVELPEDPLLRGLILAWRSVLDSGALGADSDFFLSGGHSLLSVSLVDRIKAELGIDLAFDAVFLWPTPRQLADAHRQGRCR